MSVDQNTVRKIANLSRIKVEEEDLPRLEGELNSILKWIEMLQEVDTEGVEPMTSAVHMEMKKREDVVDRGGRAKDIIANAPASEDQFFLVPKVIE
ncbi:Aspartyl-tRNA(Asn) amidotransferase subunit C @ Glutamyl-tRNA(Gln) amidotransferase subunit C [hydrothermal vent metagenome]|uniref:Aspartyl-tRNA(Asn) amidotransferase subunit C @ Glutamyl-tRNA(Gln) amidotransferase subunit C n=1 Tax=hydrothermal vent metagenome TaxID=652676 RepID=A0A3B0RKD7_9ZZZZ